VIDNINWKFVATVAIIAMAVSLLSGGLGGIPLGILITRALIGGVVFLILAFGLNLLLNRFFPEIWETAGGGNDETSPGDDTDYDGESPGSRVDIVLPAEQPEPSDGDESPGESKGDGDAGIEELEEAETSEEPQVDNLDRFSGSFSDVDEDLQGTGSSSSRSGPAGEHDPEEIAQAIHTVIKRDEKG